MLVLIITNSTFLSVLALIHLNWAIGGTWGFAKALPTNLEGKRVINPKKIDSAIVGIGLMLFAFYFLIYGAVLDVPLPNWILTYGIWAISGIFLFRSIGDFKYIGFFKRIKKTEFGRLDSIYYSPLCLFLAVIGIALILLE